MAWVVRRQASLRKGLGAFLSSLPSPHETLKNRKKRFRRRRLDLQSSGQEAKTEILVDWLPSAKIRSTEDV